MLTNPFAKKPTTRWIDSLNTFIGTALIGSTESLGVSKGFYHRPWRRESIREVDYTFETQMRLLASHAFREQLTTKLPKLIGVLALVLGLIPIVAIVIKTA